MTHLPPLRRPCAKKTIIDFDPNAAPEADAGVFGLPHREKDASLILVPVPWEVTTSYGSGTSHGPSAILEASGQIDLFDRGIIKPYEPGIFMRPESAQVRLWNKKAKALAQRIILRKTKGSQAIKKSLKTINDLGSKLNSWVHHETSSLMSDGKIVGIVGGDHSVPYGAFQAVAQAYGPFGLLHFDAHSDTRIAYEGFTWSHASIMYNALSTIPQISKIVQVGIRDFCEQEYQYLIDLGSRAEVFFDRDINKKRFAGQSWAQTSDEIIQSLPQQVWITFDIDGLDPKLCPHTGTPVPGGLQLQEAEDVIERVARSGRKIIGFDLVEVTPDPDGRNEWDANVAMRLLYKLAGWTFVSRGLCKTRD
jgi:agmatinase